MAKDTPSEANGSLLAPYHATCCLFSGDGCWFHLPRPRPQDAFTQSQHQTALPAPHALPSPSRARMSLKRLRLRNTQISQHRRWSPSRLLPEPPPDPAQTFSHSNLRLLSQSFASSFKECSHNTTPPPHTPPVTICSIMQRPLIMPEDLGSNATIIKWTLPVCSSATPGKPVNLLSLSGLVCAKGDTLLASPAGWTCPKDD